MNNYKNVLKNLNKDKLELETQKVELGSINELKRLNKITDNAYSELNNLHKDFIKAIDKLNKQAEEVRRLHNDNERLADEAFFALGDFEKKAKDLGVDFKTKEYNDLEQNTRALINIVEKGYQILKGR